MRAHRRDLSGLRIVIVIGPLELGGAERQALLLARHLRDEHGADVSILGTAGRPGRFSQMCDELSIPWRLVYAPLPGTRPGLRGKVRETKHYLAFARELRRSRPDVLLPFMTIPNVACGLVWRFVGARTCIWNQRNADIEKLSRLLFRVIGRLVPTFVSNSTGGAAIVARYLGVDVRRVAVVHNGVELPPALDDRDAWRARIGAADEDFVACMIANYHTRKDHSMAIRAWREVVERLAVDGRRAVLALAGRNDGAQPELQALALELGIGRDVVFLGPVSDIAGLVGACDAGILCSHDEGLPNGVLEPMSAGIPVLGTRLPGTLEAVGVDGARYFVPAGDSSGLATRILELALDDDLRREVGAAMLRRIRTEFSAERMVESMVDLMVTGQVRPELRPTAGILP